MTLERNGYAISDLVLASSACERIAEALPSLESGRGGVRNLIEDPTVLRVLRDERFLAVVRDHVDADCVAVKATLFDKSVGSNWRVQWHQDRVIAVRERTEQPGYGPWSVKHGVVHVEPPSSVLDKMVAVRIHLDDSGPENGPLRVIARSHRSGKLTTEELLATVDAGPVVELSLPKGAILLMRPLLVHASSSARTATHRRVLHIELAPRAVVAPVRWRTAIALF